MQLLFITLKYLWMTHSTVWLVFNRHLLICLDMQLTTPAWKVI